MKKLLLYIGILWCAWAQGQDVQLSQYYFVPAYLNPAMVGIGSEYYKVIAHSRLQWNGLNAKNFTNYFGLEKMWEAKNSGFGILASMDNQGENTLNTTEVQLQYSYSFNINDHERIAFGLNAGIINRKLGDNYVFPDEYTSNGYNGVNSADNVDNLSILYPDFGAGVLFFSKHLWLGLSAFHLNRPNQSFTDGEELLPVRLNFHAGYKIDISETKYNKLHTDKMDRSLFPVLSYKGQGRSDQFEAGMYAKYDIAIAGIMYRGISFKKYEQDLKNHESLIFMGGVKHHNIHITYSYDAVISRLSGYAKGAHELSLNIVPLFPAKAYKRPKPMKLLPCPAPLYF